MSSRVLLSLSNGSHLAACAAAVIALGLIAAGWTSPGLMELWLLVFVLAAGFTVGALGFLMIGHLLSEIWLHPVRDELEPMARAMPLIAILGVPLLFGLDQLYPWAWEGADLTGPALHYFGVSGFVGRSVIYVGAWTVLAALIARPGRHRTKSIVGLMILVPTVALASIDWVASREPHWISSLYGFSFAVAQALAALGLAMLVTLLRQGHPPAARLRSLQSLILSLALLTVWIWFSQFLIVWMTGLPQETAWFFARLGGGRTLLQAGIAIPALAVAIILFIAPHPGRARIIISSCLILIQHVAHMVWLVRPRLADNAIGWIDAAVPLCALAVWTIFLAVEIRRQPPLEPEYH